MPPASCSPPCNLELLKSACRPALVIRPDGYPAMKCNTMQHFGEFFAGQNCHHRSDADRTGIKADTNQSWESGVGMAHRLATPRFSGRRQTPWGGGPWRPLHVVSGRHLPHGRRGWVGCRAAPTPTLVRDVSNAQTGGMTCASKNLAVASKKAGSRVGSSWSPRGSQMAIPRLAGDGAARDLLGDVHRKPTPTIWPFFRVFASCATLPGTNLLLNLVLSGRAVDRALDI